MEAEALSVTCDAKGCAELATVTCDRCGRLFCPNHVGQLVIQRRVEDGARPTDLSALARLPTRSETYALCVSCRSKPIPFKSAPRTP
jgi:hypothetical protein